MSSELEHRLFSAIDAVFRRHERLWWQSKHQAMNELALVFADRIVRAKMEISARDRRIGDVSRHFEHVVAQLTDKVQRDPKTTLMNFVHFTERLEAFLTFERRSRWCVVGMVDIAGFKTYNDTFGHQVGDAIIGTVARLLQEQVREGDLLAHDRGGDAEGLHGRFGGDEFCFMLPNLPSCQQGYAIAERFRDAVRRYGWSSIDARLANRPVRVDVGVVCLRLGAVAERRGIASDLTARLLARADQLMYAAKAAAAPGTVSARVEIQQGELVDLPDDQLETPAGPASDSLPHDVAR